MEKNEINEKIKLLWRRLRTSDKINYFCDIRRFIEEIVDAQLVRQNKARKRRYDTLYEKIGDLSIKNRDNIANIRKAGNAAAHWNNIEEINDARADEITRNIELFNKYSKIGIFQLLIPILNEFGYDTSICTYNEKNMKIEIIETYKMPFSISNGEIYEYVDTLVPNVYKCKSERISEPGMPSSTKEAYISETYSNRYESVCNLVNNGDLKSLKNKIISFNSNQEIVEKKELKDVNSNDSNLKYISIISPLPTTLGDYFDKNKNTMSEIDKLKIVRDLLLICKEMGSFHDDNNNGKTIQIAHRYINPSTVFIDSDKNVKLGLFNWAKVHIEESKIRTTTAVIAGSVNFTSQKYEEYMHPLMLKKINKPYSSFSIEASKRIDLYSILMIFRYLTNVKTTDFIGTENGAKKWYKKGKYEISLDFFKKISEQLKHINDPNNWVKPFLYQDIIDLFNEEIGRLENKT